jgi:hypothetical protein
VIDAFMMFTVFGGFACCAAFFRAQYMDWRQQRASDVKKTTRVRLLYQLKSSHSQKSIGVGTRVDPAGGGLSGSPAHPGAQSRSDDCYVVIAQPRRPSCTTPFPPAVLGSRRNCISDRAESK